MSFRISVVDQAVISEAKRKAKLQKRRRKYMALWIVGFLTLAYSGCEIFLSVQSKSLAMLTDGLHNLSDVAQLVVAYVALSKSSSGKTDVYTYGWKRAEVIGALMNACFLVSLCIYILFESIPKFVDAAPLFPDKGLAFIGVAAGGIFVNGVGSIIFAVMGGHGHSHGGHGHSHAGGHGHVHQKKKKDDKEELLGGEMKQVQPAKDLNMYAVLIHYVGDCVASGCLLASGLLAHFFKGQTWTFYLDPITSLLIAAMLLWSTLPLIKECGLLLMQHTPEELVLEDIRQKFRDIKALVGYHDFHVWELADNVAIASLHVVISDIEHSEEVQEEIKKVFHKFNIHSNTIQVEVIPKEGDINPYQCYKNCKNSCKEDWCCKGINEGPTLRGRSPITVELKSDPF